MTMTHVSHFGLDLIRETTESLVFVGGLGACKRMAAAHGMEIDRYEGFLVSSDSHGGVFTPASPKSFSRILYRGGGMVQKGRDDYTLVMPRRVWEQD